MSAYNDFKRDLEKALGIDEAPSSGEELEGGISVEGNPKGEIVEQAEKIAAAVKSYLIALAGDTDNVRKPGGL